MCNFVVCTGAVEACLSQGLRRRALGLFKTSSTTALLHKVGKSFGPAAIISRKVLEIENSDPNRYVDAQGNIQFILHKSNERKRKRLERDLRFALSKFVIDGRVHIHFEGDINEKNLMEG